MEFEIFEGCLEAEDFVYLYEATGWGKVSLDMAQTALQNSWATFCVKRGGETVAMARLLGDGAMAFFLKDFVVRHDLQGKGIGKMLLEHVEEYIRSHLKAGWKGYLQLVSAKGKEGFYSKAGYATHPHEHSGHGMSKWIKA